MNTSEPKTTIGTLNKELLKFASTWPQFRTGLVDFYIKHARDRYLSALNDCSGTKVLLQATSASDLRALIRFALVLGDTVVFDCAEYLRGPTISSIPLPDDLASPVLAAATQVDSRTGDSLGFAEPEALKLAMAAGLLKGLEVDDPFGFLGADWSGPNQPWVKTPFCRTSQQVRDDHGRTFSRCVGPVHVWIPEEDALLEDLRPSLENGHAVYAPFIRLPTDPAQAAEGCLKALAIDAAFTSSGDFVTPKGKIHGLGEIEIPYLEGIDLPLLARILADEGASLSAFRTLLHRSSEDLGTDASPDEATAKLVRMKREMEDEIENVRKTCERLSRMNALARIGAYVAVGALSVGGCIGLTPAALVVGGTGATMATINALYKNYEDKKATRDSPMYFAWRLKRASG